MLNCNNNTSGGGDLVRYIIMVIIRISRRVRVHQLSIFRQTTPEMRRPHHCAVYAVYQYTGWTRHLHGHRAARVQCMSAVII